MVGPQRSTDRRSHRASGSPACFGACRPGGSVQAGHPFRWMPAGYFGIMPAALVARVSDRERGGI